MSTRRAQPSIATAVSSHTSGALLHDPHGIAVYDNGHGLVVADAHLHALLRVDWAGAEEVRRAEPVPVETLPVG